MMKEILNGIIRKRLDEKFLSYLLTYFEVFALEWKLWIRDHFGFRDFYCKIISSGWRFFNKAFRSWNIIWNCKPWIFENRTFWRKFNVKLWWRKYWMGLWGNDLMRNFRTNRWPILKFLLSSGNFRFVTISDFEIFYCKYFGLASKDFVLKNPEISQMIRMNQNGKLTWKTQHSRGEYLV